MAIKRLAQLKADARRAGWLDQVRTPNDERALLAGYYFDKRAPEFVCEFARRLLVYTEDTAATRAGDPFEFQPWQRDEIIYPLYGWRRPNGLRRFRQSFVTTAKKQGKTTLSGVLVIVHLVADGEPNPEIYSAAAKRDQAGIVYRQAAKMIKASPALLRRIEPIDSRLALYVRGTAGYFLALASDANTNEGLNYSFAVVDELHAHPDSRLWDALVFGGAARRQPLLCVITTSGAAQDGICWEQYTYAKSVLAGEVEDLSLHAVIHEAPPGCALDDPKAHKAANPSLGIIETAEALMEQAQRAKATPGGESRFRRYKLNQWINVSSSWLPMDKWDACGSTLVDWDALKGAEVFGGLDLSSKLDMTAFVIVAPFGDGYAVRCWFFAPHDQAVDMAAKGRHAYTTWADRGHLTLCDGGMIDYSLVAQTIIDTANDYKLVSVATDPWNAGGIQQQLTDAGIPVVDVPQIAKRVSDPAKWFEAFVRTGRIYHNNNPILRWNAGNARVRYDVNNNILPQRPTKGGPERIDGISATVCAFAELKRVEMENRSGVVSVADFINQFDGILTL